MKKRMILLISTIAIILVACQKDKEELPAEKSDEIKQLEEVLGIELKEITDGNIGDAIYIHYESLKERMENKLLSRNPPPTTSYPFTLRWKNIPTSLETTISNAKFSIDPPFSVNFKLSFRFTGSSFLDFNAKLYLSEPYLIFSGGGQQLGNNITGSGYRVGADFKFSGGATFRFSTQIGGRNYEFFSAVTFDLTFPASSNPPLNGRVSVGISF